MYGHKHHKKHGSSSSSSSSSDDNNPYKKEQKRQKKLQKKMKKHGGVMPPGMYPAGAPGAGYPGAPRPGYPAQPGYPQQAGYPQQQPGYPAPQPGYPAPQQQGYPPQQPGYPAPGAAPFQGAQQPYPGQQPQYPMGQQPYPGQQQPYPGQGYPSGPQAPLAGGVQAAGAGYPGAPGAPPYPAAPGYPAQQAPGYPGQQAPGYPAQQAPGYPGQQAPGYPAQPGAASYPGAPGAAPGYPAQPGAPAQPAAPGQPAAQPAYQPPVAGTHGTGESNPDQIAADLQRMKMSLGPGHAEGTVEKIFGTITPAHPFNVEKDTEVLRKAMKGAGTDEKAIINVVCNRSNQQRQAIKQMFKTMYGKDLIHDLKSELSGDLEEIILALFKPTTYYDAWSLHKAMKGAGTKESILIEILCTRTNSEIKEIVQVYQREFHSNLEKDIDSETHGHFQRLLISSLQGNRAELSAAQLQQVAQQGPMCVVDMNQAKEDAKALYKAGEGKLGTDESTFLRIFATRNFYQLRQVFREYQQQSGHTIIKAIEKEFSGDLEKGFKAVAKSVENRPEYFADKMRKAMKGAGTDESTLIRVICSRSEIDLGNIKQIYQQKHGKPLAQAIKSETRGDFERILLGMIK